MALWSSTVDLPFLMRLTIFEKLTQSMACLAQYPVRSQLSMYSVPVYDD